MEDLLQCPICFLNYNQNNRIPRQLNNCQHIICSICLPYMIKKRDVNVPEHIECPMCKNKLFSRLDQVPKSLITMQLIDATLNRNVATNKSSHESTDAATNYQGIKLQPPPIPPRPSTNYISSQRLPEPAAVEPWDTRCFLKAIFNEIDINHDGSITAIELQEALRRGQANNEFNIKTIELLISRYDKNSDREISFGEFFDLYCNLNEEYEAFLMMDEDGSNSIDFNEFSIAMIDKGYTFSKKFFMYIVDEIGKHTKSYGIKFDNYIRVMARFEYLCEYYRKTPYFHSKHSLESYLKNTFFQDFW